jgi:transcriptional regulator with XRE-family HTH domain
MIEGQWRAARALIGWSQGELAAKIGMSVLTIKRLEAGAPNVSDDARKRAMEALESAGVEFTNGDRPGVRLKSAPPAIGDEAALPEIPETEGEPYQGDPT